MRAFRFVVFWQAGRMPRRRRFEPDQEKRMDRYLPLAAALLALPHLLSIAIRNEPAAAAVARTPRAVAAQVQTPALTAHCAASALLAARPRPVRAPATAHAPLRASLLQSVRAPARAAGVAAIAPGTYLQR
ncbi:hypothetical protein LEN_2146 [Lysobacter enzymogenes]|uniref:Uncharacterized protein n=2 Tax=Lysobacter enzymogenes TaxID=69 RepID=A0AAU9AIL9_LYSEN|nr:hypothetical protein LEN_2146 [Lysobacter enzymogenes]